MLIVGAAALCLGLLQFRLNTLLFPAVFAGRFGRTGALIAAKLAIYGLGIAALLLWFRAEVIAAAVGFGAGFLIYMLIYTLMKIIGKDG